MPFPAVLEQLGTSFPRGKMSAKFLAKQIFAKAEDCPFALMTPGSRFGMLRRGGSSNFSLISFESRVYALGNWVLENLFASLNRMSRGKCRILLLVYSSVCNICLINFSMHRTYDLLRVICISEILLFSEIFP